MNGTTSATGSKGLKWTGPFVCPDCGAGFGTTKGLITHRARWCPKRDKKGKERLTKIEGPAEALSHIVKDLEEEARVIIPAYRDTCIARVLKYPSGDTAIMIDGESVARFSSTDNFEKVLGLALAIMILARKLNEIIEGRK